MQSHKLRRGSDSLRDWLLGNRWALATVIGLSFLGTSVFGQTWNGAVDSNWSNASNWTGTAPTSGGSSALTFSGTSNVITNNDLTNVTATGLNFTNTANGQSFTIGGNQIFLGGNLSFTQTATAADLITDTISADLTLTGNRSIATASRHGVTISSILGESGGVFGITKTNAGTVTLSGINTFTGALAINNGTVSVNTIKDAGVASSIGAGTGANSRLLLGNGGNTGLLEYRGVGDSSNRQIAVGGSGGTGVGGASIDSSGTGALIFSNAAFNTAQTTTATRTLTLGGTNTAANEIQGVIQNNNTGTLNLAKSDGGRWILSNAASTYSGNTTINNGTLEASKLSNAGVASSIGAGTTIRFGNNNATGVLRYTGSGDTTDRQAVIGNLSGTNTTGTGSANIQNNGTGALTFTNANFNQTSGVAGNRSLILSGNNTGNNLIAGIIQNNSATDTISLVKNGVGTWSLGGANTYTGTTNVNAGTLAINNTTGSATGTGSVLVNAGGTLAGIGSIGGTLTVAQNGVLAPGNNSIGSIALFAGANANLDGTLTFDLDGATGTADLFDASGSTIVLGANSVLQLNSISLLDDQAYVLLKYNSLSGSFGSVNGLQAGYSVNYAYQGNSVAITVTAVPEPSSLLMVALLGGVAYPAMNRRRRKAMKN